MTTPAADYTPTPAEVRNRHAYSRKMNGVPFHSEEFAARFDRWLDTTIRQAKAEALREAAVYLLNRAWPIDFFPGVAGSARDLEARASRIEAGE